MLLGKERIKNQSLEAKFFFKNSTGKNSNPNMVIRLMEEILHHLECINLVSNGINYLPIGAGFLP